MGRGFSLIWEFFTLNSCVVMIVSFFFFLVYLLVLGVHVDRIFQQVVSESNVLRSLLRGSCCG